MLENEEVQRLRDKVARAQELSDLCRSATHRLNTSLAIIQGYAQLLLEKDLDEETKSLLKKIEEQAEKAAEIIAEFTKAAKEIDQE